MDTATVTTRRLMTAAECWREVATRKISLTPALGLWIAEVWINGGRDHNRKRPVRSVSAIALSPIGAVAALVAKLNAEARELTFEEIGR